jgi:hypothetical protein
MRVPSSTPGGISTESVRSRVCRPVPLQSPHGFSTTSPAPWQAEQVRSMVKKPWLARTRPTPPQVPHTAGCAPPAEPVPEQPSQTIDVGTPAAAAGLAAAHELAEQIVENV